MKTTDLKLFTLEYINLQDSLDQNDKLDLMEFVQTATREEVMSLLFTGKPRHLEEGEDKFVTELFNASIGQFLTEATDVLIESHDYLLELQPDWQGDTLLNMGKTLLKKAGIAANDATPDMVKKAAAVAKKMGKTAYDMDKAALKKVLATAQGKASIAGTTVVTKKASLGNANFIKALASKWASFKVPTARDLGGIGSKSLVTGTGDSAAAWGNNYNQAIDALNKGVPVAAAVVTALVLMLARKAYKAYLTKAARACKGTKGVDKNECIKKFKVDAVKMQIKTLNDGKKACQASKSPKECVMKVDNKINKKQIELHKIMSKAKVR